MDDAPIEFEWTSVGDAPLGRTEDGEEGPSPATPGGWRRGRRWIQASIAAFGVVVLAVVVTSVTDRESTDPAPRPTVDGRLPARVQQVWERTVPRGLEATSARIVDDTLLFVVSDPARPFQSLFAVDVTDGSAAWERRSSAETRISVLTATETSWVVVTRDGGEERLVAYDVATGELRWEELRDGRGAVIAVPGTTLLLDIFGASAGEDASVIVRDPDSGDVLVELVGAFSGLDLAGKLRFLTPTGDLQVFDAHAFDDVRNERGVDVAIEAVVPETVGGVARGVPFVVDGRAFGWDGDGLFDAQGTPVPTRSPDRQPVELSAVDGVLAWGADRAVIQSSDGPTMQTGVLLRGGVMQVEWKMEGTRSATFMSVDGPRATVEFSDSPDRLVDLVTGEVLAEFDAASGTPRFAANGVLVSEVVDGSTTTPTAIDAQGERLWSVPSAESMLGVAVGDGIVVTTGTSSDVDGASPLRAYSG